MPAVQETALVARELYFAEADGDISFVDRLGVFDDGAVKGVKIGVFHAVPQPGRGYFQYAFCGVRRAGIPRYDVAFVVFELENAYGVLARARHGGFDV